MALVCISCHMIIIYQQSNLLGAEPSPKYIALALIVQSEPNQLSNMFASDYPQKRNQVGQAQAHMQPPIQLVEAITHLLNVSVKSGISS